MQGTEALLSDTCTHADPSLVSSLCSEDVEVTLADGGRDQVVSSSFVSVRGSGQQLKLVVSPAARVFLGISRENRGGGDCVYLETTWQTKEREKRSGRGYEDNEKVVQKSENWLFAPKQRRVLLCVHHSDLGSELDLNG